MKLRFTKMQGAGNDFVVVDGISQQVALAPAQWRRLADRHFGIGADQLLLVERPGRPDVDFRYRIFNADGGEVEHCGNGARCFVRYVREKGLTDRDTVRVKVRHGVIVLTLGADGRVTVDMGAPVFDLERVPFEPGDLQPQPSGDFETWPLPLADGQVAPVAVLSMGNPHAVLVVPDVETAPVAGWGPQIENHACFPRRVNAGFLQVLGRGQARLRVYERGAGETLACGTGACAAVVAGIRQGLFDTRVDVQTRGGLLTIEWAGNPEASVMMTGPATTVFEGEIDVPDLP